MINYNEVIDPKFASSTIEIRLSKEEIGQSILNSQYKNMVVNILLANADNQLLAKLYSASNGYIKACPFVVGQILRCNDTRNAYSFPAKTERYLNMIGVVQEIDVLSEKIKFSYSRRNSDLSFETKTFWFKFNDFETVDVIEYYDGINDDVQQYTPIQTVTISDVN